MDHKSDCAVHNEPAYPKGQCDCGAATSREIRVVFDGPPGPSAGRFVEVEDIHGCSINLGSWHEREDGLWELRIPNVSCEEQGNG